MIGLFKIHHGVFFLQPYQTLWTSDYLKKYCMHYKISIKGWYASGEHTVHIYQVSQNSTWKCIFNSTILGLWYTG